MGIPCYYKEMVAIAAQESGLVEEFISNLNSDKNAVMRELYLSTDVVQRAIVAQDKAIKKIADAGSCVIIGRAADHVLRDMRDRKDVVRIFIYAPEEYQGKKVMEMYGDTEEAARRNIARSNSAKSVCYKKHLRPGMG